LLEHKVLLPDLSTLARLEAGVRDAALERLWSTLAGLLTPDQDAALVALVDVPDGDRYSTLNTLRSGLRSKTPDMVAQEFWAMLCVYQAVRDLIGHAAPPGLDPGRVSFKRALESARDSVTPGGYLPLPGPTRVLAQLAAELVKPANLTPKRPGRSARRARKRGGSDRYPRRPDGVPAVRRVTHTIVMQPITPPTT
jgi:hypothetical protein